MDFTIFAVSTDFLLFRSMVLVAVGNDLRALLANHVVAMGFGSNLLMRSLVLRNGYFSTLNLPFWSHVSSLRIPSILLSLEIERPQLLLSGISDIVLLELCLVLHLEFELNTIFGHQIFLVAASSTMASDALWVL